VGEVDPVERRRHRQVRADGPQRRVRLGERCGRLVRVGARRIPRFAEAVHVDVHEFPQRGSEVLDVHPGSAVDVRGVLTGE
jgi:hypothetical protein